MFITKKKFQEELAKKEKAVAEQWERKFCEVDKEHWREHEAIRYREDVARRFEMLEKRVFALEKEVGLVKETTCSCATRTEIYY